MEQNCSKTKIVCNIRKVFSQFLLEATFMYVCTLTKKNMPHITPVLYFYEKEWCVLNFLVNKHSIKAKNLRMNPYVSLTTDETHPTNPFLNTGIMLEAVAQLSESYTDVQECLVNLRSKYRSQLKTELVETFATENEMCVKAYLLKGVYWKGPFFQNFICVARRSPDDPLWKKP
ncbi:MAG: pyridoxamine 5'-phosphate oxidase family protein [Promethearchaeota archaeon]